jgi:hypothetical protein
MAILNPAPPWRAPRSRYVTLWHGCLTGDKDAIQQNGVDVTKGRVDADFGRGFYTTTLERQAEHWAWVRYYAQRSPPKGVKPVVLRFRVDRHQLAALAFMAFVRGDYNNGDYWGLVQHCRQSTAGAIRDHKGPVNDGGNDWYDVAYGPVAAFWDQRVAMIDSDQMSFHTQAAAALLTALIRSGSRRDYQWRVVK